MMVCIRNTAYRYKSFEKFEQNAKKLIQGVSGAGLEGFRGTLGNRGRVGRVSRRVDSTRSERMRAMSGKSFYVAPIYEKLDLLWRVTGNSLRSANLFQASRRKPVKRRLHAFQAAFHATVKPRRASP